LQFCETGYNIFMNRRKITRLVLFGLVLLAFGLVWLSWSSPAGRRPGSPLPLPQPGLQVEQDVPYLPGGQARQVLDVYAAPASEGVLRPAVLFLHGGGWAGGSKAEFQSLAADLAQRGYVAFNMNYRLSPGSRFPDQLDDAQAAVRWLRANAGQYGVDPQRIAAVGSSAGGHLASLLGVMDTRPGAPAYLPEHSSRVSCVVNIFGPTDLMIEPAPSMDPGTLDLVLNLMGAPPEEDPDIYRLASPIYHIDQDTVPFLLFHGALDRVVPVEQSRRFYQALRQAGRPADYIEFPGEGHGFSRPANRETFSTRLQEFLQSCLQPSGASASSYQAQ
jgi:acetyl esterase/lipase